MLKVRAQHDRPSSRRSNDELFVDFLSRDAEVPFEIDSHRLDALIESIEFRRHRFEDVVPLVFVVNDPLFNLAARQSCQEVNGRRHLVKKDRRQVRGLAGLSSIEVLLEVAVLTSDHRVRMLDNYKLWLLSADALQG